MFIEIAGIDGSGKTTYAERVMRLFNDRSVPCYQRSFRSTTKRIAADIAAADGVRHWSGYFQPAEIEVAHAFEMVGLVYQQILPLDLDAQVIVTDSYVTGWLASAALWGVDDGALRRLRAIYAKLPRPDLSLVLDIPVTEAERRIASRPKGDHVTKTGPNSVLHRYAETFHQAVPTVPYPQTTVDVHGDLDDCWARLATVVLDAARATGRHQLAWNHVPA